MVAVTALAACGDDEPCPYEVEVKSSLAKLAPEVACRSIAFVERVPAEAYGIPSRSCASLCGDAKMNSCDLQPEYIMEFERLNGEPVRGADLADAKCPEGVGQTTLLQCARVEVRGEQHSGCPVAGRRPRGLLSAVDAGDDEVAAYLAQSAHLEAASVLAFETLAADLAHHDAPALLVIDCLVAAEQEVAHAAVVTALARARGAAPSEAKMRHRSVPSLLELALENEIEGVVRESYGALQALVSARTARALDVRSAMDEIAVDEVSHAALSARIASWLDTKLTDDERRQVAAARREAINALRRSLDDEPKRSLVAELGVPSRALSLHLLDGLEATLWAATANG